MLLINITAIILLIIVFLLAIILLIPYTYLFDGNSDERKISLSISWLFGILKIQFSKYFGQENELEVTVFNFSKKLDTKASDTSNKSKKIKKKKNEGKKGKKIDWKNHINRAVINEVINLVKRIWARLKPGTINLDARVGFDDPMYTGLLYGLYCQFLILFSGNLKFQPVFNEEVYEGKFSISGRIWIFVLLIFVLRFLFSSPVRKELKLIRKERGGVRHDR